MRIRTDGKYSHRKATIKEAAAFWDCNNTAAVLKSCEFTCRMQRQLRRALEHPDMTEELVEVLSTPEVRLSYTVRPKLNVE